MKQKINEFYEAHWKEKVDSVKEKYGPKFSPFYNKYINHPVVWCILISILLEVYIESAARGSLLNGLRFFVHSPRVFLYNVLIILATLSISLLIKRRVFYVFFSSSIWIILGSVNGVILSGRMTPFTTADMALLETGLGVLPNYFSSWQIALMGVGIVILLILYVLLFIFAPKSKKYNFKKGIISVLIIAASLFGGTELGLQQQWLSTMFANLAFAYEDYGFPYCFINTWINTGVRMPVGYSEEMMDDIINTVEQDSQSNGIGLLGTEKQTPNIVFVQLESFFDPYTVKGLELSQDPIPNYHEMEKNYSSGYLMVPAVGAGTANSEFEVLSGMRTRFFGPGEYPYKTSMQDETCETIAYDLKQEGYATHAIHNHRGVFYDRNTVYANLGFDDFTSLEYILNPEMNPRKWCKDSVLTNEIMNAINTTEEKDLVFTVSVQGHGKYPTSKVYKDPAITVGGIESEGLTNAYEYYVNQIHEMDQFIKELTDTLENYDEDVVLVLYGDHLPSLDITDSQLVNNDVYQTKYVIWSNFRMRKIDTDLKAYQLSSTVLGRLGIENGFLTKFHQTQAGKASYLDDLQAIQYDVLYGKQYIFNGKNPYPHIDMKMGTRPIKITGTKDVGGHLYIKGQNFTEYSHIQIGDELIDTVYVDTNTLRIPSDTDVSDLSRLKISQIEKYNEVLSTTE